MWKQVVSIILVPFVPNFLGNRKLVKISLLLLRVLVAVNCHFMMKVYFIKTLPARFQEKKKRKKYPFAQHCRLNNDPSTFWMFSFYEAKYSTNQYCLVHEGVLWFTTLILYCFLKRQLFLAELFFPSWQPYAHTEKAFFCNTFFSIGNQNSKEVDTDVLPRPVSAGHWEVIWAVPTGRWYQQSSRRAELWGSFALFSPATAPSAWGVLLNTSFDWINIPLFTFSDLLFAAAAHTSTTSTHDTQDGNWFPTPGLDRTNRQHQMGLVFQSIRARDWAQTWVVDKHYFCCLFSKPSMSDSGSCSHWWLVLFLNILQGSLGLW